MNTFRTVFEVTQSSAGQSPHLWHGIFLLIFFIFAIYKFYKAKKIRKIIYLFLIIFLAVTEILFMVSTSRFSTQRDQMLFDSESRGETSVVEGKVDKFVPMPAEGHMDESFWVGTVYFYYSDYYVTGGFNNTSSHGGPIREGLKVKIHYLNMGEARGGNVITKLEIENPLSGTSKT